MANSGGDFNKDLLGNSGDVFGVKAKEFYSWAQPIPEGTIPDKQYGAGKVIELLGKPDLVAPIHNQYGAQIGEKWTYFRDGKTVVFTISPNGRVLGIIESR